MSHLRNALLVAAGAALLGPACHRAPSPGAEQLQAQEVWLRHQTVVAAASRGERIELDAFHDACVFFETLTGIVVPGEASTYIDWAPTDKTATALEPLARWFAANHDRLYWDEQEQEVRLRPP